MWFKTEMTDVFKEGQEPPQQKCVQSRLDALAEIDAFVMAHTNLEAKEFFRQLRRLDAWRMLSSAGEKEKKEDVVAR